MNKKSVLRSGALLICGAVCLASMPAIAACSKKSSKDSIVIMSEELSGLYNPFYATSGADQDVIGMTQIGMLTYDIDDSGTVKVVADDDHATVAKAYYVDESSTSQTVYTFVIKNGLKFSDGVPLTINDVFFNLYEYLDPVYTGSSTMYSVDIKGLATYRTQKYVSGDGSDTESAISSSANSLATTRRQELIDLFEYVGEQSENSYYLSEADMRTVITGGTVNGKSWTISNGYKLAVTTTKQMGDTTTYNDEYYQKQLLEDYEFVLKTHKEEIESDFSAAKESFDTTTAPYKDWKNLLEDKETGDIFKFLLYEGKIEPVYAKYTAADQAADSTHVAGQDNLEKITGFGNYEELLETYNTEEKAINKVYTDNITYNLDQVLSYWGTAGTVLTEFTGLATEIAIKNTSGSSGSTLTYPNIEGIVSLGHTTTTKEVTIGDTTYKVAHDHNADGTPKNSDEYDVLQITVNGVDPKAIYNFGFSVAPAHIYSKGYIEEHPIDIANNSFGVEYASSSFQSNIIKSLTNVEVPVGAGAYMATDRNNSDNPSGSGFVNGNIVYFKANHNFMFDVKTEKVRMQVVSSSNALDALQSGEVDFVTPQFTTDNSNLVDNLVKTGNYGSLSSWQLGYGYIGINAGKVPNINIRKAIMSAMETSLATAYYKSGTCKTISWPMSMMNWAYPWASSNHTPEGGTSKDNDHDYTEWSTKSAALEKIQSYMDAAGVKSGSSSLKITFTIAGTSITEHPTYQVFKQAAELLNSLGWQVTVRADSQALTKLSTGSLAVWAAAWGSTIDPDMYQVYHMNSTATSTYAWGYREIKAASTTTYKTEYSIITQLSGVIDDARETLDQTTRTALYETAMGYVLDLAVELPVYQRQNLYVYNAKTVRGFPTTVNAYTSPLEKIWELELIG